MMKPRITAVVFFLILCAALPAQERAFRLAAHPFDMEETKKQVDEICSQGFMPAGLEVDEGEAINILYVEDSSIIFKNWLIYRISDPSKMESEYSALMQDGWLPMGISRSGSGLYVLFLKTDRSVLSWRITQSGILSSQIDEVLTSYESQDFNPYGISLFEDKVWFLFLKTEKGNLGKAHVSTYRNDESSIREGIAGDTAQGRYPWGLMIQGPLVSVLYLQ